jgi:hypothetical protein
MNHGSAYPDAAVCSAEVNISALLGIRWCCKQLTVLEKVGMSSAAMSRGCASIKERKGKVDEHIKGSRGLS